MPVVGVPRVLIIAGSDSGGGAGIQADIKTVTMLGGFAMTAVTAITAQNTLGVSAVFTLPAALVGQQISAVLDDIGVDVVKIGMLGSGDVVRVVRDALALLEPGTPVVLDPVMVATSGDVLNEDGTTLALRELVPSVSLITPNVPELAALTRLAVTDEADVLLAARSLAAATGVAVLAKGGHLDGATVVDMLVRPDGTVDRWEDARIETRNSHGTGCTLASAIATSLGQGIDLPTAITRSRRYVRAAMLAAPGFGTGHGPLGHGLGRAHDE